MVYTSEYKNERYFTSPHAVNIPEDMPLVFLAGPVQGAPNYQDKFAQRLLEARTDIAVASPRRTAQDQAKFEPIEQVRWELASRRRAYFLGVTGIWYAAQDFADSDYPVGREYAKTTAKEHFETIGRAEENPNVRLVVGIDPAYEPNMSGYNRLVLAEYGIKIVDNEQEFIDRLLAEIDTIYNKQSIQ